MHRREEMNAQELNESVTALAVFFFFFFFFYDSARFAGSVGAASFRSNARARGESLFIFVFHAVKWR